MYHNIYATFCERKTKGQKSFAVLVDPDHAERPFLDHLLIRCKEARVDYLFLGGSLIITDRLEDCTRYLKKNTEIPVILFPGSPAQISPHADALLYLSLISGRNPELLIGQHVLSAPILKKSGIEVMPTGYMVIDGGAPTTVSYISNASPIPSDKEDIAMCTAMAGEMLGLRLIYLDAGSGARKPVPASMIRKVASQIHVPLIVGGGIRNPETAFLSCQAGADVIVVGNAIEKGASLVKELSDAVHSVPVPAIEG